MRSRSSAAQRFSRPSSTAPGCRSTATATQVSIYTRSLDDVTDRLPEVVEATRALPVRTLIADGEAIALRPDGRPDRFQVTASRFGRRAGRDAVEAPLSVFFFDVLHVDGVDLLDLPTTERLARLDAIVPAMQRVDRLVTPTSPARRPSSTRRWPPATKASWPSRRRRRTRPAAAARAGSRSSPSTRSTWWCSRWSGVRADAPGSCRTSISARVTRRRAGS